MIAPDVINGLFEFVGSLFTWMSVRRVWKDRGFAGIFLPAIVFFTAWGFWNCFYYPYLQQYWSFAGGLSIVTANVCWVSSMLYFGHKESK